MENEMNALAERLSRPLDPYLSTLEVDELELLLSARAEAIAADRPELELAPEDAVDDVDYANANNNRDLNLRLADRERKVLAKVQVALERICEGEYGVCQTCGEEIGFHRLRARPFTDKCIDCKTQDEMLGR